MKTLRAKLLPVLSMVLATLFAGCGKQDTAGTGDGTGNSQPEAASPGATALAAALPSATAACVPSNSNIVIDSYTLVSSKRVSRTAYEETYAAKAHYSGTADITFIAGLASTAPQITVKEADLSFHGVKPATTVNSTDTFTVLHDRTKPFDPAALVWTIFEVDTAFAATLESKGVPDDVAEFFASAQWCLVSSDSRNLHFLKTFPNGATLDRNISFGTTETYTPTDAETAAADATGIHVYAASFSQTTLPDDTAQMNFQYFVPYSAMPVELQNELQTVPVAAAVQKFLTSWLSVAAAAGTQVIGSRITVQDVAKKGAEAGLKSLGNQLGTGAAGNVLKISSAAGNVAASNTLRGDYNLQLAELEALRECAAKPTNPLAQGDPGYIARTTSQLDDLISEYRGNVGVRFLGYFTSTLSGLIPGAIIPKAALSLGSTSNDRDLELINDDNMDVARKSVTSCLYPFKAVLAFEHEEVEGDGCLVVLSLTANVSFDVGATQGTPGAYTFAGMQNNQAEYKFGNYPACTDTGDGHDVYVRSEGTGLVTNMLVAGDGPQGQGNHLVNLRVGAETSITLTDTQYVPVPLPSGHRHELQTLPSSGTVIHPPVVCNLIGVNSLLGGAYNGQIETSPLFGVVNGAYTKHICTVTLTPVKP